MAEIFELPPSKKPDEPIISQHTAEAMRAIYGILHDNPERLVPFYIEVCGKFKNMAVEICQQFNVDEVVLDHVLSGGGGELLPEVWEKMKILQEQVPEKTLVTLRTLHSEIRQLEKPYPSILDESQEYKKMLKEQKDSG